MHTNSFMKIALPLLAVLVLMAGGCNGAVDDPDSSVILQLSVTESPSITGQDTGGVCNFTITEWSADFINAPKNSSAVTSPYNDIIVRSWVVSYSWPGNAGIVPPPDRLLPVPGTVPANSQQSITFSPILFDDLTAAMAGTSAIMTMSVDAVTQTGDPVGLTILEQLDIESCAIAP